MPLFPASKLLDMVIGLDFHTVVIPPATVPWCPHPYFGLLFLWHAPKFPMTDVFINGMPACTVGAMGYSVHIPVGAPVVNPCVPYWYKYLTNVVMGVVLMVLTIMANQAIAAIAAFIPKPKFADDFIRDVTGIDTTTAAMNWSKAGASFAAFSQWQTWVRLLMPPIPYPGSNGSAAVGSPNVTVNGAPLAFAAPLVAASCSELPVVPNAVTLGFSNVLVGVSIAALIRGILVSTAQAGIAYGVSKGVSKGLEKITKSSQGKQSTSCSI